MNQVSRFGVDFITLAELQAELLRVDSRDATRQLVWPLVLSVVGLGFIIGCFPLAVFGISWWLAAVTELSLAGASLIVATAGLIVAAIVFYGAWRSLTQVWQYFNRSREEFKQNVNWFKRTLADRS
ncbi:phage holin family protein [Thalassoroseus pseudoceratinae]|uniref:phage holin family protein n=1 Tax=Thalassoroseus pseudoceratinae TaxID=2713176 RepID=UPI0014226957|nr:phage holin family protein [Thalassoroseus pseudoceratinae]